MESKEVILSGLEELRRQFGEWTYDIPLPYDIWTGGQQNIPHTRLKRIVQIVHDLCDKPLSQCRVLDLGCLEGLFSIEFASHGAEVVGIEIREANIKKAIFCQAVLGLGNLTFLKDDVRNINPQSHGTYDAIICSGLLYHLPAADAIELVRTMFMMSRRLVVIDTHIALHPEESVVHEGHEYWGKPFREYTDDAPPEKRNSSLWAAWANPTSFWFTRPSLINMLTRAGFSSVYECFVPAHINFGKPGIEHRDRCTIVAVKDNTQRIFTSPSADELREVWPENSLSYAENSEAEIAHGAALQHGIHRVKPQNYGRVMNLAIRLHWMLANIVLKIYNRMK